MIIGKRKLSFVSMDCSLQWCNVAIKVSWKCIERKIGLKRLKLIYARELWHQWCLYECSEWIKDQRSHESLSR